MALATDVASQATLLVSALREALLVAVDTEVAVAVAALLATVAESLGTSLVSALVRLPVVAAVVGSEVAGVAAVDTVEAVASPATDVERVVTLPATAPMKMRLVTIAEMVVTSLVIALSPLARVEAYAIPAESQATSLGSAPTLVPLARRTATSVGTLAILLGTAWLSSRRMYV